MYLTYNFLEKDPIIDVLRSAIQVTGVSYKEIEKGTGVSYRTLYGWFVGSTRFPRYASVAAVAGFLRQELVPETGLRKALHQVRRKKCSDTARRTRNRQALPGNSTQSSGKRQRKSSTV